MKMFQCLSACTAQSQDFDLSDSIIHRSMEDDSKAGDTLGGALECDYDEDPTPLFKAIEQEAWWPILEFLQTGTWPDKLFLTKLFRSADPLPPDVQARTWVTKRVAEPAEEPLGASSSSNEDVDEVFVGGSSNNAASTARKGFLITSNNNANSSNNDASKQDKTKTSIKWSMLPVHAAIRRNAPYKIVDMLLVLYPQGIRCTDDKHQLPMHLAVMAGADDAQFRMLAERFPDAVRATDANGAKPIDMDSPRQDLVRMLSALLNGTARSLQYRHARAMEDEAAMYKAELKAKDDELQRTMNALEAANVARQDAEQDAAATKLALEACRAKLSKRDGDKLAQTIRRQVLKQHKRLQESNQHHQQYQNQSQNQNQDQVRGQDANVTPNGHNSIVGGSNGVGGWGHGQDVDRFPKSKIDPDATGTAQSQNVNVVARMRKNRKHKSGSRRSHDTFEEPTDSNSTDSSSLDELMSGVTAGVSPQAFHTPDGKSSGSKRSGHKGGNRGSPVGVDEIGQDEDEDRENDRDVMRRSSSNRKYRGKQQNRAEDAPSGSGNRSSKSSMLGRKGFFRSGKTKS